MEVYTSRDMPDQGNLPRASAPPTSGATWLPSRVLLIQTRRLGDVVLSTALLQDLHRAFPQARLDYLVGAAAAPLLIGHPLIHERIVLDPSRTRAMWREVRSRRYDLVVDVQGNLRTALIAWASRAPIRVGWRTGAWWLWYTHTCARARGGAVQYVVRDRQRLLEHVGIAAGPSRPSIHLSCDERERGERDARAAGAPPDSPRVGFVISSAEPAKDWRLEGYATVAAALARQGITPLIFEMTPSDAELAQRLVRLASGAVIVPARDLRCFLGVLSTCRVLLSGDTGPAHMADAVGVPRVTIYGPTPPAAWSPGLPTTVAISGTFARDVPARDRARLRFQGHDFTGDVTPEMVLEAVEHLLGGPR